MNKITFWSEFLNKLQSQIELKMINQNNKSHPANIYLGKTKTFKKNKRRGF